MKLIVGLGNPGKQYEKTRHNLGFTAIDRFVKDFKTIDKTEWLDEKKFKSDIIETEWIRRSSQSSSGQAKQLMEKIILCKPKTHMNNSGMAVSLVANFYKINANDIWIMYDDLDLPIGTMKIRFGGAAAGHHGVESIMEALNTDKFWRFRLGIGIRRQNEHEDGHREKAISRQVVRNAEDYVLGKFGTQERGKVRELIKHASKAIQTALEESLEIAMNRFNTK